MHRKGLVIGILILMLGVNIGSTFAGDVDVKTISPVGFDGNTLYVGGSGPNNYTTIQSAVNDAVDGDTVFVYDDSSPYHERNINVYKSINLIGENKDTTIVDADGSGNVFVFRTDGITITGFTLQNAQSNGPAGVLTLFNNSMIFGNVFLNNGHAGVRADVGTHDNIIFDNIIIGGDVKTMCGVLLCRFGYNHQILNNTITGCEYGIYINCVDSVVSGNIIMDNDIGIFASNEGITITDNIIENNSEIGIGFWKMVQTCEPAYCLVTRNIIDNSYWGIRLERGGSNVITENIFTNNSYGIYLMLSIKNDIVSNNFIQNIIHATFFGVFNTWDKNYWGRPRVFPKPIFGRIGFYGFIPWVKFDWHPAQEPYDIP